MLTIKVQVEEGLDESTNRFVYATKAELQLEHSLVSLSKWESKWEIAFLGPSEKTPEMLLDYIRMMTLNEVDPEAYDYLSKENLDEITEYINSKQTAAWFNDQPGRKGQQSKIVTSDLIYYWMVALNIPFTCETWHLNRLTTLIRVTELENQPKKNMPRKDAMRSHRSINAARRARHNTNG